MNWKKFWTDLLIALSASAGPYFYVDPRIYEDEKSETDKGQKKSAENKD